MRIAKICLAVILTVMFAVFGIGPGLAENKQLTSVFNGTGSAADPEMVFTVEMNDAWFSASSANYSQDLARLSMGMAGAAFRSSNPDAANDKDRNIRSFFEQAGFTDYEQKQYDITPTIDTIGTAMARKTISDGGETYTLIAIAVSGAGYGNEWLSNFSIENGREHSGFAHAASLVEERFADYRARFAPEGRVKVWIAGYSRASAVSNLTAHDLITADNGIDPNDIFAYCFAVPLCTREPVEHPQINNICGAFDPVPMIPFAEWGYGRHGVTHYITAAELDEDYNAKAEAAAEVYYEASGRTDFASSQEANWLLRKVLEMLHSMIPDAASYTAEFQTAIKDAWVCEGSIGDRINILIDEVGEALEANGITQDTDLTDLAVLMEQFMYNSMMETYGAEESTITHVLTSGMGLAHEHFPGVYMSWLLSSDEDTLFGHANGGYRLSVTSAGNYDTTVENLTTGSKVVIPGTAESDVVPGENEKQLCVINIGSEFMLALPGGCDYKISIRTHDTACQMALTSFTCGSVSSSTIATQEINADEPGEYTVYVMADGTARAERGTDVYPFESGILDGSVMQELKLYGNNSGELLFYLAADTLQEILPHVIMLVLLILSLILLGTEKAVRRKHMVNERISHENLALRILFYIAAVACLFQLQMHFRYIAATLAVYAGNENMIQRVLSNMFKYSSLSADLIDTVCYLMLSWLCIRATIRTRSLKRCRHLAILMLIPEVLVMITEADSGSYEGTAIASVVTVLYILILTIVTGCIRRKNKKAVPQT